MKRFFFFISFLMCMVMHIMAYQAMVVEGYSWNVVNLNASLDANNTVVYSTHVEMFEGDSVVDGVAYKKLWSYKLETPESRTLEGLIREDVSAQKVWAYGNGIEALMYDFDVEAGDTLSLLGWLHEMKSITAETMEYDETIVDLVVDNVEIVNIGGLEVKKITLFNPQNRERKFDTYERFGSLRGWLLSDFGMVDGGGVNFMVCAFDNNDELLFKPTHNNELDEKEDCYINEIKTNISNIESQLGKVYYNVESRELSFDIENPTVVSVYDAMGRLLHSQVVDESEKQMSLDLSMGIYVVRVKNDCDQMFYSKIVVR